MSTEPEFLCPQWPSSHLIYLTLTVSKQKGSSAAPESPSGPNIYSVVQMILNPSHSCATTARPGSSLVQDWFYCCQRLRLMMRLWMTFLKIKQCRSKQEIQRSLVMVKVCTVKMLLLLIIIIVKEMLQYFFRSLFFCFIEFYFTFYWEISAKFYFAGVMKKFID